MKNIDINKIRNTDVFKVPDNYFDTLTERVMSKIPAESENVISINQGRKSSNTWWKWPSIAACISILAVGTVFMSKTLNSSDIDAGLASNYDETTQEEILNYSMVDGEDVYCYLSGEDY